MSKICLNLGAQVHHFDSFGDETWINQDIVGDDPGIKVELVCDANNLPYVDSFVDFIYAGHLVEHYYPDTLSAAIAEWKRVLKPGGTLVIVTPDCGTVFRHYASGIIQDIEGTWQQIYGRIYHYDGAPERHHIAFDWTKLCQMVGQWNTSKQLDFNNPPPELAPFMGNHISTGAYQLGIVLTK